MPPSAQLARDSVNPEQGRPLLSRGSLTLFPMIMPPHIQRIRDLLGPDALLLPWPAGSKGTSQRWKHLTADSMDDPVYLEKLAGAGNIGVALGEKSAGLCSLDIDSDENLSEFVSVNPQISRTLQTKGSRGGNFWWRFLHGYPPLKFLKRNRQAWGEF